MSKITKLTKEQTSKLDVYRDKAIEIGFRAEPRMDETKVKKLIDDLRTQNKLEPTKEFIILDSPFAAKKEYGLSPSAAAYGQHDSYWLMTYAFYRFECGLLKETDSILPMLGLASECGWYWFDGEKSIVTRRPKYLHLAPTNRGISVLHNPSSMALEYQDGTGVYALNGVRIPTEYVKLMTEQDAGQILRVPNTTIKGALIRNMGSKKMFESLPHTLVHKATIKNGGDYSLLSIVIEGLPRTYLSGTCPSKGDVWYEAVSPDCKSVEQALAWREWGKVNMPYLPPIVRT